MEQEGVEGADQLASGNALICDMIGPRGDADSLELFRLKNDFMYSVFNKCLLSDMGKTIVRKHFDNKNAQRVWEEFATHMTTSSKGKAEKCRLHTYVTTTNRGLDSARDIPTEG